jgi:hypothetical protein
MNDSLMSYQSGLPETREESLSRQFYEWERRGRGWQMFDYAVELEPPFRPFYIFDVSQSQSIDDGRKPTFFSNLFEGLRGSSPKLSQSPASSSNRLAEYQSYLEQTSEPDYCRYLNDEFTELRLVLPKNLKITKSVTEQLLLSFSYAANPAAFEIIGDSKQIVVQFAATKRDSFQVEQQIKSHLPDCLITETDDYLSNTWINGGDCSVIADFGLSHEFMLPLETISNFDTDLLVSIIGAMANLSDDEVAVFQVLFQKARCKWAEEMMDSVRYFDGTPFFVNAPEMIPLAKEKISRPLFAAVIRAAARTRHEPRTWQIVRNVSSGLSTLSNPVGNELIPLSNDGYDADYHEQGLLDRTSCRCGMILNSEELVSIVHPPSAKVRTEKLVRESEKTKAVPNPALNHSLILGENYHQGEIKRASLSCDQRTRHIHVIGSSGSGKSTLMLNLIKQDLNNNQGLCVIDPHGDLVDDIIANVPDNRINDVVLFDPSDAQYPIGFNILRANSELEKTLLSSDLTATFRRMSTSWGDVMDSVLANAILAFVESSRGGTLFELKRFLVEKDFRNEFLSTVRDDGVRYFWHNEFPLITGKPQSSILIRLDTFLRQRLIRNIVCQKESRINFREIMDKRKVLLIKLSQGLIGEENAYLLGTLLVSKIYQTALSRQDSQNRPYFWLYMDEFQHFITPSMESVLSGARKYNLGLILAHQEFRQLQSRSQEVASSVLSNCYTRICFRPGDSDAEKFAGGFSFFDAEALQNLSVGEAIARIERRDYDFNLKVFSPVRIPKEAASVIKSEVIFNSRRKYARSKDEIESDLFTVQPKSDRSPDFSSAPKAERPDETKQASSPPIFDKGSTQHQYLQNLVKRIGEKNGFRATIEKQVFGAAGRIDVALENDNQKIACEISVTTPSEYELNNINKCLAAGYSPVIVISPDKKHLKEIKQNTAEKLIDVDSSKIAFVSPDEFPNFLETIRIKENTETGTKGYKINVAYQEKTAPERKTRLKTISDLLKGAVKRRKPSSDE